MSKGLSWSLAAYTTIAALVVTAPLSAQDKHIGMDSGSDAYATCRNLDQASRDSFICVAWINGVVQATIATVSTEPAFPDFCPPERGGSIGQYADVFVMYLRDNPGRRHLPAIVLFREAMAKTFPCR